MVKAVKAPRAYKGALRAEQAQMTRDRILEAARRLLSSGTYSSVTMEDIATEAGVAYQTVYANFGTKQKLAHSLIEVGFPHVADALKLFDQLSPSDEPEVGLRTAARVSRLIYEACADLLRFMRESGDPRLLARYRAREKERLVVMKQHGVAKRMERSGRLRDGLASSDAMTVIWSLTGPDPYTQLVFDSGWTPDHYEKWLGDTLINAVLQPKRT